MSISENIESKFRPIVEDLGYDLAYAEYLKEGQEWYLRFFINKSDGIDLTDCETVSRAIEPILDEEELVPNQYILEVSSLGLERPLRNNQDYEENIGSLVMAHLYTAINKKKIIIGILKDFGESVALESEGEVIMIPKKNISKINLIIDF
ncbi:hypothetical protein AZF37_03730 [endosymbiont 'TC1' of Trimyema compressum]|uniref:ribosome maturation factor RimP n=1 Tax=endosymbiont 'TC1' of Trimyema compressum TaxID=243899 RepID=UPI0007F105FD|nr:ribosome maturation factor RimP [endosymbiont 'TC1' of Trimyema compressum]AMP20396.1 hypothetical protein AZF37_03730 [endosymbiont 'TC1' of Trimyema compressum]